ncbi:MAG: 3'-5' exonuclease [Trueperaceae bacterium]|nr:3'-5' exonuclease [Trueperaceae bacterium]
MHVYVADSFLEGLARLEPDARTRAQATAFDVQARPDHPSLRLHRVEGTNEPFWTASVDMDLRIVLWKRGDVTALCWVDRHDPAYAWARRHRFVVNPETHATQLVATERVVEEVTDVVRRTETRGPALFAAYGDAYLTALGVPEPLLPAVKDADEATFLDRVADHLPPEAQERLLALAAGEVVPVPRAAPARDDDPLAPFGTGDARRHFHLIEAHATKALERALGQPWSAWSIFLHPDQRDVVDRAFDGPARLRGGAGTGKTVVALHRAVRLAREGRGPVLLTTYSRTLAERLAPMLDLLMDADDPARARLTVAHLHRYATEAWTGDAQPRLDVLTDAARKRDLARAAVADAGGDPDADAPLLLAEWERVIDPHGLATLGAYLAADRRGRGEPLGPAARRRVWTQIEALRARLAQDDVHTFAGLAHALAARLDGAGDAARPFAHVVADETQDFGAAELRLLRALAPAGPDDLFVTGDPGQRIYAGASSLLAAGIDVRGRSHVLRVNYRTSEQIRRYAERLLPDVHAEPDGDERRPRVVSTFRGPEPDVAVRPTVAGERDAAADWLKRRLQEGYRPEDVAIFARTRQLLQDRAKPIVRACGLETTDLARSDGPTPKRVAVGTLHRAKGLEFKVVLVVAAEEGQLPNPKALDAETANGTPEAGLQRERNLLHVGVTRARERLLVTGAGERSRFLLDA